MAAKTNYFSHDAGARNDSKIVRLRMRHGAAGYGVYFMLLERLREENDYCSTADYEMIAYDLRVDVELVRSVVEDFGLFQIAEDGATFCSRSFNERMSVKDEKSRIRSEAGKRGGAPAGNANAKKREETSKTDEENKQCLNEEQAKTSNACSETSKESKGKERRGKKNNVVVVVAREATSGSSVATPLPAEAPPPTAVVVSASPPPVTSQDEAAAARLQRDLDKLQGERLWVQTVRMQFAIHDDAAWHQAFVDFHASCIAQGSPSHVSLRDLKAHFTNWLRIRCAAAKREQDENNRRPTTKRAANEAALNALAQRRYELDHGISAEPIDRPC